MKQLEQFSNLKKLLKCKLKLHSNGTPGADSNSNPIQSEERDRLVLG
jgi:hypothetical protein